MFRIGVRMFELVLRKKKKMGKLYKIGPTKNWLHTHTLNSSFEKCFARLAAGHAIVETGRNIAAHQTQTSRQFLLIRIRSIGDGEFLVTQRRGGAAKLSVG